MQKGINEIHTHHLHTERSLGEIDAANALRSHEASVIIILVYNHFVSFTPPHRTWENITRYEALLLLVIGQAGVEMSTRSPAKSCALWIFAQHQLCRNLLRAGSVASWGLMVQ